MFAGRGGDSAAALGPTRSRGVGMTEPNGSVSRRDLIKKGAFAGGLVWATPVLSSITPAAAGTPPIRMDCPDRSTSLCPSAQGPGPLRRRKHRLPVRSHRRAVDAPASTPRFPALTTSCDTQPCEPGLICVVPQAAGAYLALSTFVRARQAARGRLARSRAMPTDLCSQVSEGRFGIPKRRAT